MNLHEKINYVEFPAKDLAATKAFFQSAFGWSFVDYGPEYAAFSNEGLDGGFFKSDLASSTQNGAALIVLYSDHLEATFAKVGRSRRFHYQTHLCIPRGHRFHFTEPSGNEFAVWGE